MSPFAEFIPIIGSMFRFKSSQALYIEKSKKSANVLLLYRDGTEAVLQTSSQLSTQLQAPF